MGGPVTRTDTPVRVGAPARILAALFDLAVVAAWAAFAAAVGLGVRLLGIDVGSVMARDLFAFATLVLPATATFALQDASPRQATFGKRRLGLVVTHQGARLTRRRSLVRSAIKFAPWQMWHTAVFHLGAGSEATGYVALAIAAQVIVLTSTLVMTFDRHHRAFHDLVAGTRVV